MLKLSANDLPSRWVTLITLWCAVLNSLQGHVWKKAILLTLILRVFLGATIFFVWTNFAPFVQASVTDELMESLYGKVAVYQQPPWDGILTTWFRWDAIHYVNIAQFGYHAHSVGSSVFYPLYPALIRLFAYILGGNFLLSALLVSTIACAAFLAGFYLLTTDLYGEKLAKWSLFCVLCYPFAIFLIAPYSESLFLALTVWMFLAARQHNWYLTGLFGFASGLARGPAILTSFALLWLFLEQLLKSKKVILFNLGTKIAIAFSPFFGGYAFLLWRHLQAYPPIPTVLSEHGIQLTNPLNGIVSAFIQWIHVRDFYTTIDIFSALLFIILFLRMIFKRKNVPFYFIVYYGSNLVLYLSKVHTEASSLQSMSRYVLTLFPAFWVLGEWLRNQKPLHRFSFLVLMSGLSIIFSGLYAMWIFIG